MISTYLIYGHMGLMFKIEIIYQKISGRFNNLYVTGKNRNQAKCELRPTVHDKTLYFDFCPAKFSCDQHHLDRTVATFLNIS